MTRQRAVSQVVTTKQYRRFAEFCDACRKEKYIGLCYGQPGVGKTFSARHYSRWQLIQDYYETLFKQKPLKEEIRKCETLFYTAPVNATARIVEKNIDYHSRQLYETLRGTLSERETKFLDRRDQVADLLIVDEADRLKLDGLEQIRDFHDQAEIGVVLIGMPGLEKRMARYPQLYSRVGFVHEFESLSIDEVKFLLERKWNELEMPFNCDDFTDQETLAAVSRITNGNFRLIHRLLSQSQRIMKINNLKVLTKEVIEAARENLVIGLS